MCALYVSVCQRYLKNCALVMLSQLSSWIEALSLFPSNVSDYVSPRLVSEWLFPLSSFQFFISLKMLLHHCSTIWILFVIFFLQLPEAFQGDENQGSAFVVQADPQRSPLLAHKSPAHYSQGPQMWQHLHHGTHRLSEDWWPGLSHIEEGLLCQECHR